MKRILRRIIFICLTAFILSGSARADDFGDVAKAVPDGAGEIIGKTELSASLDIEKLWEKVLSKIFEFFGSGAREALGRAAAVVAAALFCSIAETVSGENGKKAITVVGVAAILSISVAGAESLIGEVTETVNELHTFSSALLPVLASASAAMGNVSSASAKLLASTLVMNVMTAVQTKLIVPLIYAYIGVSAASAVMGGAVKSAAKLIKWAINSTLIVVTTGFTIYMSVSGAIASTADAVAVKVTKTAISNLIPVVGKLIADAADSVASGFSVVRAVAGTFGIAVLAAAFARPVINVLVQFAAYKLSSTLCEPIVGGGISSFISDLGTAMGFALASAGASAVMLYVSIVSCMRVVSGV